MKTKLVSAILVAASFCSSIARCQQDAVDATAYLNQMGPTTLDRAVEGVGNAAEITAATDSSNATIKVSRALSDPKNNAFSTFTLTASAPIDDSNDRTELVSLDGLRNAFSLGAKFAWFRMSGRRNPTSDENLLAIREDICAELTGTYRVKTGESDEPNCDTNMVKKYIPERYVEYRNLLIDPRGSFISYGFQPKVGYKKYSFLDGSTLSEMSESKEPWSLEAFVGWAPSRSQTLITLGGNYQSGFKDADSSTLCPAPSGSSPVTCKSGPVGKPVSDDAELLYVEVRRQLGLAGVSLKVTHDFKESLTGVDLPIAFIKGQDGSFTGGIRLGWNDTSHWQAGIFAGKAFSLFDN